MALDNMQPQEAPVQEGEQLTKDEMDDLDIMVNLSKEMIDDGGIDVIDQAIEQSNDPAQVIGQFLMQMVSQLGESLPEDMDLSPRIFFAYGGWVEQISDYLQEQYGIPQEVMDRVEMFIGTAATQMQQGEAAKQPAPQPTQAGPVMPQGGVV